MSADTLLVALEITGTGADTVALLRSVDGGANWAPFQNGLGAGGSSYDRVVSTLLEIPGMPGAILAGTWSGISRSTDSGMSWQEVTVPGRYFFLASGEGNALTPYVRRSNNGGATWTFSYSSGIDDMAIAMAFDPSDPVVAFLGLGAGTLLRTADNGLSWSPVPLPVGVSAAAMANRKYAPLRIYARGAPSTGGGPFFKSDDGGTSWTPVSYPAWRSVVSTILVRSGAAADTVFLGTGNGVLRFVETDVVGVSAAAARSRLELRVHPNPLSDRTQLTFHLARAANVSLRVVDAGGREVARLLTGKHEAGPHSVVWKPKGLPTGAYFCHLRAGDEVASRCTVIVR
jgi:hypothetical protein